MRIDHGTRSSAVLDALRALAAFAVLAGHARGLAFVDWAQAVEHGSGGLCVRAFYLATGLGHQAVMVFFVLSGFFIGQSIRSRHEQQWSLFAYLVDRVTRLWVVVVPALCITACVDLLTRVRMPELLTGEYPSNIVGRAASMGLDTFVGNALFLQTIAVPVFGSNGALWSLANEFWYYLLFPLVVRAFVATGVLERLVCAATAVCAATVAGVEILSYFPVWLMGAAVAFLPRFELPKRLAACAVWVAGGVALATLAAARAKTGLVIDYALGATVSVWLLALCQVPSAGRPAVGRMPRLAADLAAFSFTLYAVHLPLLVLARAWSGPGQPLRDVPDAAGVVRYVVTLFVIAWFARLLASGTERHTPRVRRWIHGRTPLAARGATGS